MTLELLLDDAPGPAPLALAVERGWATLPAPVRTAPGLTAAAAREHTDALVLLPVAEYALVQETHVILPALAAGGHHGAATVLAADRRLDEIDAPIVDLDAISRTSECLARATLGKFYGITGATWTREDGASDAREPAPSGAQEAASDQPPGTPDNPAEEAPPAERPTVEIREGGEALHLLDAPGDAVVADLGRAWFILTGLPYLSHLLVAPRPLLERDPDGLRELVAALPAALGVAHERRRELRRQLADRYGVSRDLLNDFYNDQFLTLTGDAQKAALALFARGAYGLNLPTVSRLNLAPGAAHV